MVCADLEGVFIPEIWINVAEKTGIEELRLTTRDIPDYDVLMRKRLSILEANDLKLSDITRVIDTMTPLPGAVDFIDWLRSRTQLIILSDTFTEFAGPLMKKLGWPTLFCHSLAVNADDCVTDYVLRQKDSKKKAVSAFKQLNFKVIALGDSYNDISMLKSADKGILFRPPESVVEAFPELAVTRTYDDLKAIIQKLL
jgi:phosphoserine / homoserine phosphotransferase